MSAVDSGRGEASNVTATVMLPTFRRPDGLARALTTLAAQQGVPVPWDLVVIDNDDPASAAAIFEAHAGRFDVPVRYVHEPRRGSAHARNRGIAESRGTITVMLDDDVMPSADWLARLLDPILAGRCDGVGGRVVLDPSVPRPRWFDQDGIGGYLAEWDLGPKEHGLAEREFIVTSNCAFRTDRLRRTGGFDPELGPRGGTQLVGDDALLTRRFIEAGGTVRWVPEAVVVHELPASRLTWRYLMRRAYLQGRSDWILDRPTFAARRFGGARVALSWAGGELGKRGREGLHHPEVAFHAICDVIRTIGALREAAALTVRGRG